MSSHQLYNKSTEVKPLKVSGKDLELPPEFHKQYFHIWTHRDGGEYTGMWLTGFPKDGSGRPTEDNSKIVQLYVPEEYKEHIRVRLSKMYPAVPLEKIDYKPVS